jgi:hypothetical protein
MEVNPGSLVDDRPLWRREAQGTRRAWALYQCGDIPVLLFTSSSANVFNVQTV